MVLYENPIRIELDGIDIIVNGETHHKSIRYLNQMKKTLMKSIDGNINPEMYFMFRNIYSNHDLRYDITILSALEINGECTKTYGHYHPEDEKGISYPELYQVLKGEAVFILQRKNRDGSIDTIMTHAKEGDVILMPPGYGHVSINPGDKALVLSNLVYDKFESVYTDFEENQGGAYYYLKGGEIVQNSNYIVKHNERMTPEQINERYKFNCKDLLKEFYENPKKFEFLRNPELLE
ncbi:MAG: glucose-6-phosphate isomerase family protein [Candidatus Micrarchaeota archaeon]